MTFITAILLLGCGHFEVTGEEAAQCMRHCKSLDLEMAYIHETSWQLWPECRCTTNCTTESIPLRRGER